jgi:hypothetical protein
VLGQLASGHGRQSCINQDLWARPYGPGAQPPSARSRAASPLFGNSPYAITAPLDQTPSCSSASLGSLPLPWVIRSEIDPVAYSFKDKHIAMDGKKAGFRSLADVWADTTTAHGHLMLTVLGGLAEFERELIRARTGEGRARAKANGQSLGRKPKLTPHQQREAIQRRDRGEPLGDIARSYHVSPSTISRLTA